MNELKLKSSSSSSLAYSSPYDLVPYGHPGSIRSQIFGDVSRGYDSNMPSIYDEEVRQCRFFYKYDPIASTVVNRMSDMAITSVKNRRGKCDELEMIYFNHVAASLNKALKMAALEYLVSGFAVIDYGLSRETGSKIDSKLGRKKIFLPNPVWVRNNENIVLKRKPVSNDRSVFLKIPSDERYFIEHEGVRPDGTEDRAAYKALLSQFPSYVSLVKSGKSLIYLENVKPILRKAMPNEDWPQPFLVPALSALKHKLRIKQMDFSIASKAIEAIRHVKVGDKDFPATEDDTTIEDTRSQLSARRGDGINQNSMYTLYTNHTVDINWVYPPIDALLSDAKYMEPNEEIFLAMGFSRVLLVGESAKSNSGNSVTTTLGPIAALNEIRDSITEWIRDFYIRLAEINGFKNVPDPKFSPIIAADTVALVQFAVEATKMGVLSKNTLAQMFSTDFETENEQIVAEKNTSGDPGMLDLVYNKEDTTSEPTNKDTESLD